ncbi:hypothetical protein DL767_007185 [Monosporascus sp. MG133]|nr:hypothetical protein DL767_007185 [Monosporascus sp. MG133]
MNASINSRSRPSTTILWPTECASRRFILTTTTLQLIVLALTAPLVLAAPTGTSENPINALKKRAYNLTCNGGQYYTCRDYYGTSCSGSGRPISANPLCENICRCEWIYECPGWGGCKTAEEPEVGEGEGVVDPAPVEP